MKTTLTNSRALKIVNKWTTFFFFVRSHDFNPSLNTEFPEELNMELDGHKICFPSSLHPRLRWQSIGVCLPQLREWREEFAPERFMRACFLTLIAAENESDWLFGKARRRKQKQQTNQKSYLLWNLTADRCFNKLPVRAAIGAVQLDTHRNADICQCELRNTILWFDEHKCPFLVRQKRSVWSEDGYLLEQERLDKLLQRPDTGDDQQCLHSHRIRERNEQQQHQN